jgi:hypothetical protein
MAAAGATAGLMLSMVGGAFPAGTPPHTRDPRKPLRPVLFYNQTRLIAQGLTPQAALQRARPFAPYPVTTVHYLPKGFQLVSVTVYPYIPNTMEPGDTQTFMKLSAARKPQGKQARPSAVPSFELDHQFLQPYTYPSGVPYFTVHAVTLGLRRVAVAEQRYRDLRTHKSVDTLYVYWYDQKSKVATEVTADLMSSTLSRTEVFKIAASVH